MDKTTLLKHIEEYNASVNQERQALIDAMELIRVTMQRNQAELIATMVIEPVRPFKFGMTQLETYGKNAWSVMWHVFNSLEADLKNITADRVELVGRLR